MSSNKEKNLSKESNKNQREIDLKEWLVELISLYREELNNLPSKDIKYSTLEDLSEPSQLLVIWASDPEFQIVFITKSLKLNDKLIEIYGPFENRNLLDTLEEKISNSKIVEIIGRDKFEDSLIHALRTIQSLYDPLQGPLKPGIYNKFLVNKDPYAVCWVVMGSLLNLDKKEVIKSFLTTIVPDNRIIFQTPPEKETLLFQGLGSYIYPPVWVGEPPKPKSLREKMFSTLFHYYSGRDIVVSETYKNTHVIVTKDGYIAVEVDNKSLAQEYINEILAVLLLRGVLVTAVREVELGRIEITNKNELRIWNPMELRTIACELSVRDPSLILRVEVPQEDIKKSIKLAELLTSDERIKTLLLLYLEAYTYLWNSEYKQSLLASWIIIEDFYIRDLWEYLISKIANNERQRVDKLKRWSMDERLEVLNIAGVLDNEKYSFLMRVKDIRNRIVHEGKSPEGKIVVDCMKFVTQIVREYVGRYMGEKFHEL
jgi:hypothetical protein